MTCVFSLHTLTVNDVSFSEACLILRCVSDLGINEQIVSCNWDSNIMCKVFIFELSWGLNIFLWHPEILKGTYSNLSRIVHIQVLTAQKEPFQQTCQPEGQEIREANRPGVVGASHAPNRGAGRRPGGGPGGEAPGSSWVYENFKVKNEVIEYTIYQLFTK